MTTISNKHRQYGVGVPKGHVARTADEAEAVAKSIGIYLVQNRRIILGLDEY